MAGFMSGFGQAFSRAFESQTERLYQKEEADKQRVYAEKMAQIQRDWDLQMQEKRQAFEAKMEKDRQRWSDSRDATSWLQTRERDVEQRKQSLFDTGLARANAISDYKRGRADKIADTESDRKFQTDLIEKGREYEDKTWKKRYDVQRNDTLRDANTKRAQEVIDRESNFGYQKKIMEFEHKLKMNEITAQEERENKKALLKAREQAIYLATDIGRPEAAAHIFERIVTEGYDKVETRLRSGDFDLVEITPDKSTPGDRLKAGIQTQAENAGLVPQQKTMSEKEAIEKGIISEPGQSRYALTRKPDPDKFGTLAQAFVERDEAIANGDKVAEERANIKIKGHTSARALQADIDAQATGLPTQFAYIPGRGYDTLIVGRNPETGERTYTTSSGRIQLNETEFKPVNEFELKEHEKLIEDYSGRWDEYNKRLNSMAQTTAYVGTAFDIANKNPEVLRLGGNLAAGATGLVRDILSVGTVISNELDKNKVISEGTRNEINKFDGYLQTLLSKETRTLAEDRALMAGQLVLATFRTAELMGQEGRNLAIIEFDKISNVLSGQGNPATLFKVYQAAFNPLYSSLKVDQQNLMNTPRVKTFEDKWKHPPSGLESNSLEDIIDIYGENARLGYNVIEGLVSFDDLQSGNTAVQTPPSDLPVATSKEEALRLKEQGVKRFIFNGEEREFK